jgi:hypothetical protein
MWLKFREMVGNSDVQARLSLKAVAWARPGGAHSSRYVQAELKPLGGARPRLGLGLSVTERDPAPLLYFSPFDLTFEYRLESSTY